MTDSGTGGNIATYFQIFDPVKPTTVRTPSLRARRAVVFMSSAARCRTPSGSPSPHTAEPTIASWRRSIGSSQMAGAAPAGGIEMPAGAAELEAVVPPAGRQLGDLVQGEIGPLAGEQGVRMRHGGQAPSWVVRVCGRFTVRRSRRRRRRRR